MALIGGGHLRFECTYVVALAREKGYLNADVPCTCSLQELGVWQNLAA